MRPEFTERLTGVEFTESEWFMRHIQWKVTCKSWISWQWLMRDEFSEWDWLKKAEFTNSDLWEGI